MANRKKRQGVAVKKITHSYLKARCGENAPHPPKPFENWIDYFTQQTKAPVPYRSWLEYRLFSIGSCKNISYEPGSFDYTQIVHKERKYTPDGVIGKVWIEAKGHFRTPAEAQKYIDVRNSNPDITIIFIFPKPDIPMPFSRVRKDGSRRNMEDWCSDNEFYYVYEYDKTSLENLIEAINR